MTAKFDVLSMRGTLELNKENIAKACELIDKYDEQCNTVNILTVQIINGVVVVDTIDLSEYGI